MGKALVDGPSLTPADRLSGKERTMDRISRILLALALLAAFGVGHVSAVGMTPDEQTLRIRLEACVIMREATLRHIAWSRLRVTGAQCLLLH